MNVNDEYLCDAPELLRLSKGHGDRDGSAWRVAGTTISARVRTARAQEPGEVQSDVSQPDNGTAPSCTFQTTETKAPDGTEKSSAYIPRSLQ